MPWKHRFARSGGSQRLQRHRTQRSRPALPSLALRLTDSLARLGVPRVIARESVTAAQGQANDPRSIGRKLGVEWLLDTLLASEGNDDLRVTARLLSAIDGGVQWIETRAAAHANRLALFDALADRVFARFPQRSKANRANRINSISPR